jgi:crossover junction endodeoxyribonuclease RusA
MLAPIAPLECVIDLPFPPSTNEIWRRAGKRIILSATYRRWKTQADMAVIANGCWRRRVWMPGAFTADIIFNSKLRRKNMDLDNRIKAVLDWAQRVELITNDCLCEEVRARWMLIDRDCRLTLQNMEPSACR